MIVTNSSKQAVADAKKRDSLKIENKQKGSGGRQISPLEEKVKRRNSIDRKKNPNLRSFNQGSLMEIKPVGMKRS